METAGLVVFFAVLIWILILAAIAIRVVIIVWCYKVGKSKGQEVVSLILGIFLGWIGLMICYVLPDEKQSHHPPRQPPPPPPAGRDTGTGKMTCRFCSRSIPAVSRFCPHCGKKTGG